MLALASPSPAIAQVLPLTVSGGYSLLDVEDLAVPNGWYADLALRVMDRWSLVFQADGAYKEQRIEPTPTLPVQWTRSFRQHGWLTGPRVYVLRRDRVRPYVQLLIGGVQTTLQAHLDLSGIPQGFLDASDLEESITRFAWHAGGGVTVRVRGRLGVNGAVAYRRLVLDEFDFSGPASQFRLTIGGVLRFGAG